MKQRGVAAIERWIWRGGRGRGRGLGRGARLGRREKEGEKFGWSGNGVAEAGIEGSTSFYIEYAIKREQSHPVPSEKVDSDKGVEVGEFASRLVQ